MDYLTNIPINTRDTVAQAHSVSWCAKIQYRTCTHVTCFKNTMGFSIPILNPTKEDMTTDEGDGMGNRKGGKGDKLIAQLVYIFFHVFFTRNSLFFRLGHPQSVMMVLTVYHSISTLQYKIETCGFHLYPHNLYPWQVWYHR